MQKTTSYILLICLSSACLCPMQAGTLLCFRKDGSISLELDKHCCHGHDDRESSHAEKKQHIPSDEDCLGGMHAQCCIDLPLGHAALDSIKSNITKNDWQGVARAVTHTPFSLPNHLKSRFRPYSTPLYAHAPPTDTIVLLI